jgi:hypothetical protein
LASDQQDAQIGLLYKLPESTNFSLSATVGAFGPDGCLKASGDFFDPQTNALADQTYLISMQEFQSATSLCPPTEPSIIELNIDALSAVASTDTTLKVRGWGLSSARQVRIGGIPQCATHRSFQSLEVTAPLLPLKPGPAPIDVLDADGHLLVTSSLLTSKLLAPQFNLRLTPIPYGVPSIVDLVPSDLNQDGLPDVVTLENDKEVALRIYLNPVKESEPFKPSGRPPVSTGLTPSKDLPLQLVAADLDNDMLPDFVVISPSGGAVVMNQGSLQFTSKLYPQLKGTSAAVARMDSDRYPDLVLSNEVGIAIHQGGPDGSFKEKPTFFALEPASARSLAVADFDGDGRPDVVAIPPGSDGKVMLLLNRERSFGVQ